MTGGANLHVSSFFTLQTMVFSIGNNPNNEALMCLVRGTGIFKFITII